MCVKLTFYRFAFCIHAGWYKAFCLGGSGDWRRLHGGDTYFCLVPHADSLMLQGHELLLMARESKMRAVHLFVYSFTH